MFTPTTRTGDVAVPARQAVPAVRPAARALKVTVFTIGWGAPTSFNSSGDDGTVAEGEIPKPLRGSRFGEGDLDGLGAGGAGNGDSPQEYEDDSDPGEGHEGPLNGWV